MPEMKTDLASFHVLEIHSYFSCHSVAEAEVGSSDLTVCRNMVLGSEVVESRPQMHIPSQSSQQVRRSCGVG